MNSKRDDPIDHYDRVSEAWNLLMGQDLHYGLFPHGDTFLESATLQLTQRMIETSQITSQSTAAEVLDVGCGTGNPACFLAETHGCRVLGISTSIAGLAKARRYAADQSDPAWP